VELDERVSVGGRAHDLLSGEIAGGTDPVLDHELLPEPVRQPLSHQPRGEIATAARCKADDKTHRPRRISLRRRDARHGRHCGSAGGQMQKLPAMGKFHFEPPFPSFDHLVGAGKEHGCLRQRTVYDWSPDHGASWQTGHCTFSAVMTPTRGAMPWLPSDQAWRILR